MRELKNHGTPTIARHTAIVCLLAAAAACGADADPDAGTSGDASPSNHTRPDAPALALGEIASFTATVSGAKDTTYEGSTAAGNIEPFGGCSASSPLRVGFNLMDEDGTQLARFRAETGQILQAGETGAFPVQTASFWYRRAGLPSRMTFEGTGTLEITRHDARRGSRRMEGHLIARGLEDGRGDRVDVETRFEFGLSCGTE